LGRSRNFGRKVNGVIVLNKPPGMTSNKALQELKHLFFANKAGHTGSLDPLATGVLPICFGEATKFSQYVLDSDKRYLSTFKLGQNTSTADSEGEILGSTDASGVTSADVEQHIKVFKGQISQVPPMVSALKHKGQPLYKLARQGIEVHREPRQITIFSCDIIDFRPGEIAELDVDISGKSGPGAGRTCARKGYATSRGSGLPPVAA